MRHVMSVVLVTANRCVKVQHPPTLKVKMKFGFTGNITFYSLK